MKLISQISYGCAGCYSTNSVSIAGSQQMDSRAAFTRKAEPNDILDVYFCMCHDLGYEVAGSPG